MNLSLERGFFASDFKESIVRPLITRKKLLTPTSLVTTGLFPIFRSCQRHLKESSPLKSMNISMTMVFMPRCSRPTGSIKALETALISVINDIQPAIDDQCQSILVLLDLSAAFDTIDHAILLESLRFCYGFSNLVLQWFTSYLVDRPQCIVLDKFSLR